ncbi:GATA transcription factor 4-like [Senna tora]|uniref:GATA transcription factor 4-like n=1 Tax=Senna tora TaxID=362788 RepID=A0A835C759_9FABA|nr:GATA transcription factor 4-like [Senna tora]
MAVDDNGDFNDIMDLQDLAVLPKFHEFPESQLCVPPDPIHDLEWFPSFSDDFISLNFPDTPPKDDDDDDDDDGVGSINSEAKLGGFTKKKARTTMKKKNKNVSINWERSLKRKRCRHCETEETPQWRVGPMGPKTLCNACGVRFKSGRLVPEYRPAGSPTFDASRHSNYHNKILRRRGFS